MMRSTFGRTAAWVALALAIGAPPGFARPAPEIVGTEAVFHVEDWGACPNDSSDDTYAVQGAVDAAIAYASGTANCEDPPTRRPVVSFPKGRFDFDGVVTVS